MFAKDGYAIIIGTFLAFAASFGIWYFLPNNATLLLTLILGFLSIFNLFFFRDPNRNVPNNPLAVVSPADGKVIQISNVVEDEYFGKEVQRISVFLSVFNVHVNRTPISGQVNYFKYKTGRFLAAFNHRASDENEQTAIGVVDQLGHQVLFKQIAGLIARRIVCHLKEGSWAKAGERMGLIRYGSRVDVFLTFDAKILVRKGQVVRAGETILATFPDEGSQEGQEQRVVEVPQSELGNG